MIITVSGQCENLGVQQQRLTTALIHVLQAHIDELHILSRHSYK